MTSANGPVTASENPASRPTRRRFFPRHKLRIVAEYDAAPSRRRHLLDARRRRSTGSCGKLAEAANGGARQPSRPR